MLPIPLSVYRATRPLNTGTKTEIMKSKENATKDDNTTSNGDVEGENEGSKKQKSKLDKTSDEASRQLVYFSITLPESAQRINATGTDEATAPPEGSKQHLVIDESKENGSAAQGKERQEDGEPLGKRARRS